MKKQYGVIISLASNENQQVNLEQARLLLRDIIDNLIFTPEKWTEPINSNCKNIYLNQLCKGSTEMSLEQINQSLKEAELRLGRTRNEEGLVSIDLDLLQYDSQNYHLRDWERDYIKNLIKEL